MANFAATVSGIGALADPLRRRLYLFVCAQSHPVGREETAAQTDIAAHKVKFHLDRLVDEGLLEVEFARLSGRDGPGAGRPAKLYRRSGHDVAVSLPERDYELAGHLMAEAIETSARTGVPAIEALNRAAANRGAAIGREALAEDTSADDLALACKILARHGYEPRRHGDVVTMANCPFHTLTETHTDMVCQMNHALIDALAAEIGDDSIIPQLDPTPGRCCVTLRLREPDAGTATPHHPEG